MKTHAAYLTITQAAAHYGVSARTISRHLQAGRLTGYQDMRDRRRVLLAADDLAALMAAGRAA